MVCQRERQGQTAKGERKGQRPVHHEGDERLRDLRHLRRPPEGSPGRPDRQGVHWRPRRQVATPAATSNFAPGLEEPEQVPPVPSDGSLEPRLSPTTEATIDAEHPAEQPFAEPEEQWPSSFGQHVFRVRAEPRGQ